MTDHGKCVWFHGTGSTEENKGEECYGLLPRLMNGDIILYADKKIVEFVPDEGETEILIKYSDNPELVDTLLEKAKKSATKMADALGSHVIRRLTKLTKLGQLTWTDENGLYVLKTDSPENAKDAPPCSLDVVLNPTDMSMTVIDHAVPGKKEERYQKGHKREIRTLINMIGHPRAELRKQWLTRVIIPFTLGAILLTLTHFIAADMTDYSSVRKELTENPAKAERIDTYNDWFGVKAYSLVYDDDEAKLERKGDSLMLDNLIVKYDPDIEKSEIRDRILYVPDTGVSSRKSALNAQLLIMAYSIYFLISSLALYPVMKELS